MSESIKHNDLFTTSGCLTTDALKRYSSDQLTNLQKVEVDGHLASCEMCSDALDGIQHLSDPQKLDKIVLEINENLKSALAQKQSKKETIQNKFFYITAAASIIILIGFYFYLQDSFNPESGSQSISQVVEMEEKSIPQMPKGKVQESDPPVEPTIQTNNQVQTVRKETTNEVSAKTAKVERIELAQAEQLVVEEEDIAYVAPLKTLRTPESIPESLAMKEIELDDEETIEAEKYNAVDIASTQPLEYYIGGIVVYDNSNAIVSNGLSGKASSSEKMNVTPQVVASKSIKGKGNRRQENAMSQEESKSSLDINEQNENHFFSLGNEVPQFPGGYEALIIFLNTNLKYPKEAREQGLQGQLVISFIVGENGEISSATIVHGIGGGCDKEAIRVIKSMPAWQPALKDEKPIRVLFNMPITFRLN